MAETGLGKRGIFFANFSSEFFHECSAITALINGEHYAEVLVHKLVDVKDWKWGQREWIHSKQHGVIIL